MTNMFDRVSKVAKAEWNHLVHGRKQDDVDADAADEAEQAATDPAARSPAPRRSPPRGGTAVFDVDAALRVLELERHATLDMVRARYRDMARRYQPKTQSARADDREAAHTLMLALTDALEILEEHLLPLP